MKVKFEVLIFFTMMILVALVFLKTPIIMITPDNSMNYFPHIQMEYTTVFLILSVIAACIFIYLKKCKRKSIPKSSGYPLVEEDIINGDFEWTPYIFKGLRNNSTMCYLNSMIQALASSEKLLQQLNKLRNLSSASNSQMESLINLLQSINDPKSTIHGNTSKLSQLVEDINWTKLSQQDAFDVLSSLINSVHEDIRSKMISKNMPPKIKILHAIKGMDTPNKLQDHLGLSVGLCGDYSRSPGVRLDYLINENFQPTYIDDDPDKTSRMIIYGNVPEILLIHIQANKWNHTRQEMIKPEYYIIYDKELSLDLDIAINMDGHTIHEENVKYQLSAVIQHMGTIRGGHYVTYRNWRGGWYLVNDEYVTNVEFDKNICPYILIYEKCD